MRFFIPQSTVFVIVCCILFTFPLSYGLHDALANARHPANRVTPLSPWVFFRRTAIIRLRYWIASWALFLVAVFAIGTPITAPGLPREWNPYYGSYVVSLCLGLWLLCWTSCILLAPILANKQIASLLSIAGGITLYVLVNFAVAPFVPYWWYAKVRFITPHLVQFSGNAIFSLYPEYNLVACLVIALICANLLSKGNRWFRFEQ